MISRRALFLPTAAVGSSLLLAGCFGRNRVRRRTRRRGNREIEDLQEENDRLQKRIDELEAKCG